MVYDYETFEAFLSDTSRVIALRDVRNFDIGVKAFEISRVWLTEGFAADTLERSWKVIEYKLPRDYVIVPWVDRLVAPQIARSGSYCDSVVLLIGSKTFPKLSEGDAIPELNIQISPDDLVWAHRTQWYWRLYKWIARPFINRFPRWCRL